MRKRSAHVAKLPRIPVTGLHGEIALTLHLCMAVITVDGTVELFAQLQDIFNLIGLTIENDERFEAELKVLNCGSRAMNTIGARPGAIYLLDTEIEQMRAAAATIDALLPRLDVSKMYLNLRRLINE